MAAEVWTLDGLALNDASSFVLRGVDCPPPPKRPEWIAGADADGAALVRDPLHENRTIELKIRVMPQASMDLALAKIGLIVDKLEESEKQPDGLALVWTPQNATKTLTFYVLSGEITGMPITPFGDDRGWLRNYPTLTVRVVCKPFGYGTQVTGATATSSNPIVTVNQTDVTGDVPAEGRLVVTDMATQNRRHVEWGLEWRYQSALSLIVDSDDMVTTGFSGTQATKSGAYDPNATGNNVITATLATQPVAVCGTGNLGHVGTFRVKCRLDRVAGGDVYLRLAWQEGDGPFQVSPWAFVALNNQWNEVDLGLITIPEKKLGTQRWTGRIEGYSTTAGDTINVDYLTLIPAAEGYGKARGSYSYQSGAMVARDEFTSTTAGNNLNARTAPLGGSWATSGTTTDFTFFDDAFGGEGVQRATSGDTGSGRFAVLGSTTYTDTEVGGIISFSGGTSLSAAQLAVVARYVDSSNWLEARLNPKDLPGRVFAIYETIAGTTSALASVQLNGLVPGAWYAIRIVVFASGSMIATLKDAAGNTLAQLTATSSNAATGGTLASGKVGLRDHSGASAASTRQYDNFYASIPPAEPITCYSGRTIEFRHDDPLRQDSTGTYYGAPPSYRGSRFLLPPAGDENRTSRVVVKARRNDVDTQSDGNVADSTKVELFFTPRFLAIPR